MMRDEIVAIAQDLDLGDRLSALVTAAGYSEGIVEDARKALTEQVPPGEVGIDVILLGSYARREASPSSDFDYLIVPHSLPSSDEITLTRQLTEAVEDFIDRLDKTNNSSGSKPGSTGLFGKIQSAADLVERIGLEQDTNTTHTRRALILQESVSIYNPALHENLLRSILSRYLVDYAVAKFGPPRFLINDLNRYWFTVAVDYQAKRWERLSQGWGIRYLKLLVTRRLSYVGGVLPLLLCSGEQPAEIEYLVEQYKQPAIARVASLRLDGRFEERDELATVLECAARFNQTISDDDTRALLDQVGADPTPGDVPVFDEMRELTKDLETALRSIFFGSLLGDQVKRYLVL
jgi:predicted nucleotidyltransferase